MEITTINQIIAACSGLVGAIVGSAISSRTNRAISNKNYENEAASFKAGFIAEVESLQHVMRTRRYLETFEDFSQLPEIIQGGSVYITILIPEKYARFYESNLSKVGLTGPVIAKKLIQYHQLLQALVQDFKPESYLSQNGYTKASIEESIKIMRLALDLGDDIISSST